MQTETLKITGMTCGGCVSSVTNVLLAVPGVTSASVSLAEGAAKIVFDSSRTTLAQLKSAVSECGFGADLPATKTGCCG